MEKYIRTLISKGMSRIEAEMFIDGLTKVILEKREPEPIKAIFPTYYKIKTIDSNTNEDLGFIKFDVGFDAKFFDYDTAKKICTYLNEHDIYRQLDSIDAVNYNKKPWLTITRDWRSYAKYITNEGNVFYIEVNWKIGQASWKIVPFYD